MLQKAAKDKRGRKAIHNASLNRSHRTAATWREEESDNDVEVVETPQLPPAPPGVVPESPNPLHGAAPAPLTPVIALLHALSPSWSPPPPVDLLNQQFDDSNSDIEIIGHNLPVQESSTQGVVIKAEPAASTIPPATTAKPVVKHVKAKTPLASITCSSRKGSASKHVQEDDSDIKNSLPTARKTKCVCRN
ncbi:hypothetical protein K438DRAFT_1986715 [Mycena galopus ATCC 62051]|nr:hypothetical protein K438DRAFT_1986715 [Mycena galopus ATCC 62051]